MTDFAISWKSYTDITRDVARLSVTLPEYACIVGVPRSGMIPALMLAQMRHCAVASVDALVSGAPISRGRRIGGEITGRILVIDDVVTSGRSMAQARERVEAAGYEADYCAVYGAPEAPIPVYETLPRYRIFEWNLFRRKANDMMSCDIDGVLCPDPRVNERIDEPGYHEYIRTAPMLYRPRRKIKLICTSRLERYRETTEAWLRENGIQYGALAMAQYETAEARKKSRRYAQDKIEAIQQHGAWWHVESNRKLAERIGEHVPTICTADMRVYQ